MANPHELADVDGKPLPDGTVEQPGRARITEFKRAKDGRRYAVAIGVNGRTVVVWGKGDSTDEELRLRADAKLPPLIVEAPVIAEPPAVVEPPVIAEPPVIVEPPPAEPAPQAIEIEPPVEERASAREAGLLVQVVAEAQRTAWNRQQSIDDESAPEPEPEPEPESERETEADDEREFAVAARSSKGERFPRKWLAVAGSASLAIACCMLAVLGIGLIAGYRPVVLTTASMSPVAPAGSLLIAQPVEPESVAVDDILVMRKPSGMVVTHRVVERSLRDGLVLVRTKGDANEDPDPAPYSVVGTHRRSKWVVPSAGKALLLLRTRLFRVVIVAALAGLIVHIGTSELRRLLRPQPVHEVGSARS